MKPSQVKTLLQDRPAEAQVILLISSLAIIRIVVALILDLTKPAYSWSELITDLSIFILFLTLLVIASRNLSIKKVHPVFGVLIIGLLGINFLQFGGIKGTNCFNFYTGIYVIVMLYGGRTLYFMLGLKMLLLIILLVLIQMNAPLYNYLLINIETESSSELVFSLVAIAVFTFYLKRVTSLEIQTLEFKNDEVRAKVTESKSLNHELVDQSKELKQAQKILKGEVDLRVKAIENQNEAIQQYIYHNTDTLTDSLHHLSKAIEQFKGETQLHTLLKLSHVELTQVITGIHQTLQSTEKLDRSVLIKNVNEKTD